jgi:transposase
MHLGLGMPHLLSWLWPGNFLCMPWKCRKIEPLIFFLPSKINPMVKAKRKLKSEPKNINKRCFPHLTIVEKQNIISLVLQGMSYREIERKKFCSKDTAKRVFLRWQNKRSVQRKSGSGRKRKTNKAQYDIIEQISEQDRLKVPHQIKDEVCASEGLKISERTVRRRLDERELFARVAKTPHFF